MGPPQSFREHVGQPTHSGLTTYGGKALVSSMGGVHYSHTRGMATLVPWFSLWPRLGLRPAPTKNDVTDSIDVTKRISRRLDVHGAKRFSHDEIAEPPQGLERYRR